MVGLSHFAVVAYHVYSQVRVLDELKTRIRLAGGDPDAKESDNKPITQEEALAYQKDPFKDFPNDIDYSEFTEQDIDRRIKEDELIASQRIKEGKPITEDERLMMWTLERKLAILGVNRVAKRAAVNSILWSRYKKLKKDGVAVSEALLKKLILADWSLLKLRPASEDVDKRTAYLKENNLPLERYDSRTRIYPAWYGDSLKNSGRYEFKVGLVKKHLGLK